MRFQEAYLRLNERQKQAVDVIYGPVLVLAGAGTGKTQVLSTRITRMLQSEAQISPDNILCLTYTDAGAKSMRSRLVQFIGPAAYRVTIQTFHSFCSDIIKFNMDYFGFRDLEAIDEMEDTRVVYGIIRRLPDESPLKRVKGDPYYEVYRMLNFFKKMKEEGWAPGTIKAACDRWIGLISSGEDPDFVYKVGNKTRGVVKGDLKVDKIEEEKKNCALIVEAANRFPEYQDLLKAIFRYDFSDMIHWVLDAFRSSQGEWLLLNYQERYQFILVDEFQDTNGPQMELISLLMGYWDNPNIFVVGDDDQCLYGFQGARIQNVMDFVNRYRPQVISLNQNYRSTQQILDAAMTVINNNQVRLKSRASISGGVDHTALKSMTDTGPVPEVIELKNILEEESYVIDYIKTLLDSDVPPDSIAVLYRKHRQAENVMKMLSAMEIPVNARKRVNILAEPIIKQIVAILTYLTSDHGKTNDDVLYEILHYPYFKLSHTEVNTIFSSKQWDHPAMAPLNALFNTARSESLPKIISYVIEDTGMLQYVMAHSQSRELMVYLATFMEFVKSYCFKNPWAGLSNLIDDLARMISRDIPITTQDIYIGNRGVTFSTVHAAKGLEWDHVLIIGCTSNEWEKARGRSDTYRLPPTITSAEKEDELEAARRLFYVATTRAKQGLVITYAAHNNDGKELEMSRFIAESGLSVSSNTSLSANTLRFYNRLHNLLTKTQPSLLINDEGYLRELIDGYVLSPSAVNKFIECQLTWYYENLIRVPFAATGALIFGNASHYALKMYFDAAKERSPSLEEFLGWFHRDMGRHRGQLTEDEYQRRAALGDKLLPKYWEDHMFSANTVTLNEFRARNITLPNGVPMKGDIDKIEFDGNLCDIADYKTGKYIHVKSDLKPSDGTTPGGGIWRQLIIYSLIVDHGIKSRGWKTRSIRVEMIDDEFMGPIPVERFPGDEAIVLAQIKNVWDQIQALDFQQGCGKQDCKWCNFNRMLS